MKRRHLGVILAVSAVLSSPVFAAASRIDPVELMRQVERQSAPPDERVQIDMQLIDSGGQVRRRTARFYQQQIEPGSLQSRKLIRFDSPPEMDKSGVLTLERAGEHDDQWLYMPAYHTSRKIPSSNRSDRYMGTDFFYEDVSADEIEQYRYTVIGSEQVDGRDYVLIEQVPTSPSVLSDSAYSRKVQHVDPERLIVRQIDYFDRQGMLFKRFEGSDPQQFGSYWRWGANSMTDLRLNHTTTNRYSDRRINDDIDARMFTVRFLERGR